MQHFSTLSTDASQWSRGKLLRAQTDMLYLAQQDFGWPWQNVSMPRNELENHVRVRHKMWDSPNPVTGEKLTQRLPFLKKLTFRKAHLSKVVSFGRAFRSHAHLVQSEF